jgi:S1-C subfamily serine protease
MSIQTPLRSIEEGTDKTERLARFRPGVSRLWTKIRGLSLFFAGALAMLLALLLYNRLTPDPETFNEQDVREAVFQAMASATPAPPFSTQVYQIIQPSLVFIQTRFEGKAGEQDRGLGSGVVINDSGAILTSLHVVDGASDIQIIYADGTEAQGEIVASQAENDIAVLSSDQLPEVLIPAVLGNPHAMQVGDEAYAVGNPFGLYGSVSAGVISGFGRTFQPEDSDQELGDLIQIDAAVNPGNSGGPLLNRYGQVIGIVVGIINPTEEEFFIGIGFAVPIDIAGGIAGIPPY